ncbi:DotA/TraY family protein [Solidesulfovibrio carbinolicus]|uniref:DotA/TraY family protein n=1 Tax=Solidesulfovibrio carbinolicus TaxID=296842 RepID=A0A4P6HJZ6_9BACT|nr:DotA/TraY family protein [Solidesulfovibrio carbinolicus]QAZ67461.1 hypothetical protein C3Y92_09590 [Solidesulfovibrio carbinolicus]
MKTFFIVLALLLCASTQAAAADVQIDLPSHVEIEKKSDLSAAMLKNLLGDVLTNVAGDIEDLANWTNPYAGLIVSVLATLNLAALTCLSALILYMWGIFSVSTAHEGKKLGGGTYNSLWVPVRHASAFALTVPVLKGLSLLQVAIVACISLSINLANAVWDASAKILAETSQNIVSLTSNTLSEEAYAFLPTMFSAAVVQNLDELQRSSYWETTPETSETIIRASKYYVVEKKDNRISLYARSIQGTDKGMLGSVSYAYPAGDDEKSSLQRQIADARIAAAETLWEGMRGIASQYIESDNALASIVKITRGSTSAKNYKDLIKEYVTNVTETTKEAASAYLSNNADWQAKVKKALDFDGTTTKKGWFGAGLYNFSVASLQRDADDLLLVHPEFSVIDNSAVKKVLSPAGWQVWTGIANAGWSPAAIAAFVNSAGYFSSKILENYSYTASVQADGKGGGLQGWIEKIASKLVMSNDMAGGDIGDVGILAGVLRQFESKDPFVVIAAMGNRLISAGYAAFGTAGLSGVASLIVGFADKIPGANGILGVSSMITSAAFVIGAALVTCGVVLAYICPITPFLYWIRALVTWIFLVVESLVAAPFWACIHALPKGEGFAGEAARKGYLLLIDIVIRPVLLVLGTVFAIAVVRVCGHMYYVLFSAWFVSNGEFIKMGLTANLVYTVVVIASMYGLIVLVFTKGIGYLPSQMSKWIGSAQSGGLGDENDMHQQSGRAVAMFGGHVTSLGNMAANRLGTGPRPQLPKEPGKEDKTGSKKGEIGPGMAQLPAGGPKNGGGGGGAAAKPASPSRPGAAGEGIMGNAGLGEAQGQGQGLGQGGGAKPAGTATSPAPAAGGDLGQGIADAGSAAASGQDQGQGQGQGMAGGKSRAAFENLLGPGLAGLDKKNS